MKNNNNKNAILTLIIFCIFSAFNAFAQTNNLARGGCDSTCSLGSAVALRSQACTAIQEYRTTNCTAPQIGVINETRAPIYCNALLVSGGNWRTVSSNCTTPTSCTAQPTITSTSACPAGFIGTYTSTQTFDSTPAICAYNAATNDSATACTPFVPPLIPPSCTAQPTITNYSACPAGFSGTYTTTRTFNNSPAICAYNAATNDSATACTPIVTTCVAQPTLNFTIACPAGLLGTIPMQQTFDNSPAVCAYNAATVNGPYTCTSACTAQPTIANTSACPVGFSGTYTTTQTFNNAPSVCTYNAATNDSATACTPAPANVSLDISANPSGGASMLITAGSSSCYISIFNTVCSMQVPANSPVTVTFSPNYTWFGPGQIFYGLYTFSSNGTCDLNNSALWGSDSCTFQTGPTGGNMFIYVPRCTNETGWVTCA